MRSENNRFSKEQVKKVFSNWEDVAKRHGGTVKVRKFASMEPVNELKKFSGAVMADPEPKYEATVSIPVKGIYLEVLTGDVKHPVFEFHGGIKDCYFNIVPENFTNRILQHFGTKEVRTGDPDFDGRFLIDTDNEECVKHFLDSKIRNWLSELDLSYFDLNHQRKPGCLCLYASIPELNKEKLDHFVSMFIYCCERIIEIFK